MTDLRYLDAKTGEEILRVYEETLYGAYEPHKRDDEGVYLCLEI